MGDNKTSPPTKPGHPTPSDRPGGEGPPTESIIFRLNNVQPYISRAGGATPPAGSPLGFIRDGAFILAVHGNAPVGEVPDPYASMIVAAWGHDGDITAVVERIDASDPDGIYVRLSLA